MKFKLFNSRGRFAPELSFGRAMWTTKDGKTTHYEREYICWFNSYSFDKFQLLITPAIFINKWSRGALSSDDALGSESYSCGIGISFWSWNGSFTFMKVKNTKTTEEINKTTGLGVL